MPKNTKSDEAIKACPERSRRAIPDEDVEVIPPGKDVDKPQKDIPLETLISLRNKGHSLEEIAKIVKCSKQNVQQRLESFGYSKERVENFKENRADVFAFLQSKILNSIVDAEIEKLNPYQRIVGASILYDKERIERGQSTGRIDIHHVTGSIERLSAQEKILEARYRLFTGKELKEEIKTDKNK